MSNGAAEPRTRRDVQSLLADGSGVRVLDDYARGIAAMRERDADETRDPEDPLSWRFQAAIHGYPGVEASIDHPNLWGSCRHFSWFFLAWHRLYLFYFERMVQLHVQDPTWSLPYWDYTKPNDPEAWVIPEPFRTPTTGNPLYTDRRNPAMNRETNPVPLVFATRGDARPALVNPTFSLDASDPRPTFGGKIVQDLIPSWNVPGSLEGRPHGTVHVDVGGQQQPPGWMSLFETAGLDPIFWLHHCNLDRLLDVWIELWGHDALPQEQAWLDTEFEFFDSDGTKASKPIGDILVSEKLGYVYESTAPPEGTPTPQRVALTGTERARVAEPELVGATGEVDFGRRAEAEAPLEAASARRAAERAEPERWYMRVEDLTGTEPGAPGYDVYLNVPAGASPGDHPERHAGSISTFGLREASRRGGEHGGTGITDVFDITDVVDTLRGTEGWDEATVKVTVVPVDVTGEVEDGGDVRAGRISFYAG